MNGISYDTFGDFFVKWHFVTARYRKDNGEIRFIYANDIAWKALLERNAPKGRVKDFPEGAAFGKVAIPTQDDPAFTSSAVPSNAVRYQIMLRQHGKYPETQNWTYAIFLSNHMVNSSDTDAEKSAACAACHSLVPERGYVFAQPIALGINAIINDASPALPAERVPFRTAARAELPVQMLTLLPPQVLQVRLVEGPIAEHLFAGTLNEMRPTLATEAIRAHMPAILSSKDGKKFSLVFQKNSAPCDVPGATGKSTHGVMLQVFYTPDGPAINPDNISAPPTSFCWPSP